VNYAEPKLNTKMRKPDPQPGSAPAPAPKGSKKRVSSPPVMHMSATSAAALASAIFESGAGEPMDVDADLTPRPYRRKSKESVHSVHDEDAEDAIEEDRGEDDGEYLPPAHARRASAAPPQQVNIFPRPTRSFYPRARAR